MGKKSLFRYKVRTSITVQVGHDGRMRLCRSRTDQMGDEVLMFSLFMPPYAQFMCGGTSDVISTVPVYVKHLHMETGLAQVGGMKYSIA